jgi:hypothetical protein
VNPLSVPTARSVGDAMADALARTAVARRAERAKTSTADTL